MNQKEERLFIPVKYDMIFKMMFADEQNTELLISFLKSILWLEEEDFEEIEIVDPHLLWERKGDKLSVVDVRLYTKSRKTIHIEIQLQVTDELKNRIVYYDSKMIIKQMKNRDNYTNIKKVISIVITDQKLIKDNLNYYHRFTFYDSKAGIEFTDLIEIHTIELEKLPYNQDGTKLYDWACFIAADTEEELDMLAEKNRDIEKAVAKLRELLADDEVYDLYEHRLQVELDEKMFRRDAEKRSMEKGIVEGKRTTAKNLLNIGLSLEQIAGATGLSYEDIQSMQ